MHDEEHLSLKKSPEHIVNELDGRTAAHPSTKVAARLNDNLAWSEMTAQDHAGAPSCFTLMA